MGRKIPFWQTLLVMLFMICALYWSIKIDDGGEPHIALILAAAFAAVVGWYHPGWQQELFLP